MNISCWLSRGRQVLYQRWISGNVHHVCIRTLRIRLYTLALKPRGDVQKKSHKRTFVSQKCLFIDLRCPSDFGKCSSCFMIIRWPIGWFVYLVCTHQSSPDWTGNIRRHQPHPGLRSYIPSIPWSLRTGCSYSHRLKQKLKEYRDAIKLVADSDFPRSDETSKSGTLPGFETKGRCHLTTKTWISVAPQKKRQISSKNWKRIFLNLPWHAMRLLFVLPTRR